MTGRIQHTIDAFCKCVLSACQVPDIVLDTSKKRCFFVLLVLTIVMENDEAEKEYGSIQTLYI